MTTSHEDSSAPREPGPDEVDAFLDSVIARGVAARQAGPEAMDAFADNYYRSSPGSAEHRAAYAERFTPAAGAGYPVPDDVDASYEIDNADELARERYYEELAERHHRGRARGYEPGEDAARWSPDATEAESHAGDEELAERCRREAARAEPPPYPKSVAGVSGLGFPGGLDALLRGRPAANRRGASAADHSLGRKPGRAR